MSANVPKGLAAQRRWQADVEGSGCRLRPVFSPELTWERRTDVALLVESDRAVDVRCFRGGRRVRRDVEREVRMNGGADQAAWIRRGD